MSEHELYKISENIPNQEILSRLAALLDMTGSLLKIREDECKRKLAGFYVLYEWDKANIGVRNKLVAAFKQLKLYRLAEM